MSKTMTFSTASELVRIPVSAVVYITANGNYSAITMADREEYVLTQQLGRIEQYMAEKVDCNDNRFIRIGKSLIVNRDFITFINPMRQKLVLSDCHTFKYEVSASREALKALKDFIEKENMQ